LLSGTSPLIHIRLSHWIYNWSQQAEKCPAPEDASKSRLGGGARVMRPF